MRLAIESFDSEDGIKIAYSIGDGVCYFMLMPSSVICLSKVEAVERLVLYLKMRLANHIIRMVTQRPGSGESIILELKIDFYGSRLRIVGESYIYEIPDEAKAFLGLSNIVL